MALSLTKRPKVWIVDDSPTDAERVRRLLSHDYDVEVMDDGAVVLERLASGAQPDLLLLDWIMPNISGVEVCRYVRSSGGNISKIPVILLTAQHGSKEIVEAFKSGANDYVSKPFVDEELKARVQVLLEAKRLLERAEKAETDLISLIATAPDPIYSVDNQGHISFSNAEGIRALDRRYEEIIGKPFDMFILKPSGRRHGKLLSPARGRRNRQ
jgi:PleD family two-component response regulator